jgi:HK97 family phage prohead protease
MPFSTEQWDGSPGRWPNAASYCRSSLVDENPAGAEKTKDRCHFPVKAPGSDAYNVNALRAVVGGRGAQANFPGAEAARARARNLLAEYNRGRGERSSMEGVELRSSTITDVDTKQRLIDLVAVPWEEEGEVFWRGESWREVFVRGAFDGIENHAGRVPVNHEHVRGQTIGKVVRFANADAGLLGTVKVGKTPLGDDMLNLADEDMVSASVGFRVGKPSDVQINRRTRLRRVMRAFVDHLAMTESPVYAGARVLAVRAEPSGLQVVEQEPLPSTPALDEIRDDEVFAWARRRLENRP